MTGKKNMVFGFFYFIFTLGLGIYLAKMMEAGGAAWLTGSQRAVLRAAHAHGNLESFMNISVGYLLCRLKLEGWLPKAASVILIIGAIFHSGMLYLGGFGATFAFSLARIGAVSLILTMLLMGIGILKLQTID